MKKIIITAGTLLLLGGGIGLAVNASTDDKPKIIDNLEQSHQNDQIETEDIYEFLEYDESDDFETYDNDQTENNDYIVDADYEEYAVLSDAVNTDDFGLKVLEDNHKKRVILLVDKNGRPQYKSVYVKKTNRLKVVDFNGGLVYNQILNSKANSTKDKVVTENKEDATSKVEKKPSVQKTGLEGVAEYSTLKSHVDLNSFKPQVVEDNANKRVIIMKDNHGKPKFKSIYIKDSNRLKVINLRGGLLYNGMLR